MLLLGGGGGSLASNTDDRTHQRHVDFHVCRLQQRKDLPRETRLP